MFSKIGKRTKCLTRFSTVGGDKGSADTVRDPRGFATKFYTEEGNLDWVYNNTPVFFIRDPSKFPHFIHTQKRNPQTNLRDADMFWDFLTTPENQVAIHQVMILFQTVVPLPTTVVCMVILVIPINGPIKTEIGIMCKFISKPIKE